MLLGVGAKLPLAVQPGGIIKGTGKIVSSGVKGAFNLSRLSAQGRILGAGTQGSGITFLANHNFDDGTYGPYSEFDVDNHVDIVDDPTGAGRGKVVRYHYQGTNQDRNRSVEFDYAPGIGYGQTIYHRHYVYFDGTGMNLTNTLIGRKLLYWQGGFATGSSAGVPSWCVVGCNGMELAIDIGNFNNNGTVNQRNRNNIFPGNMQPNQWYRIETRFTVNSTASASDGSFQLWVDGTQYALETGFRWTDPAWPSPNLYKMDTFFVGDQVSRTDGGSFDEFRYVDQLAYATSRIGV